MARKKQTDAPRLAITQVRSRIGRPARQRRILDALGLRRHQQTVVHNDTPAIRGMIGRIPHLVEVREITEE
ncbi:MAG: 50S ribosomal protein L30 [Gemmatimonadetes bacterium]|nr:50S ribosomal protein L30 [Gemmatimonadota bacterium]